MTNYSALIDLEIGSLVLYKIRYPQEGHLTKPSETIETSVPHLAHL